jgi:Helix-turn-helix domain, rpiR family
MIQIGSRRSSPRSRRLVPNARMVWSEATGVDAFADRMREHQGSLSRTMSRVVRYIEQNRVAVLASSAAEIARRTRTSDATVIRAVQALGFTGLPEMRRQLISVLQHSSPVEGMSRTLQETGEDANRAIELVMTTHAEGMAQLRFGAIADRRCDCASRSCRPDCHFWGGSDGPVGRLRCLHASALRKADLCP